MGNNAKVSILIPIYNVEKYIERCVRSVMTQDYNDIEFVFVNDGTTDESMAVLDKVLSGYPELSDGIKILEHKENLGLAAARMTAVNNASGDYLMHVDSDDYLPNNSAVTKLVEAAIKHNADIVGGSAYYAYDDGYHKQCFQFSGDRNIYLDLLFSRTYSGIIVGIWGRLIKTDLYKQNDISTVPEWNMAEDYCVVPRLVLKSKKIVNIDDAVYCYYQSNKNSMSNTQYDQNDFLQSFLNTKLVYDYMKMNSSGNQHSFSLDFGIAKYFHFAATHRFPHSILAEHTKAFKSDYLWIRIITRLCQRKYISILGCIIWKLTKICLYTPVHRKYCKTTKLK